MRLVLLGPPGAGKGSLAALFQSRLGLTHLSTGEIFRHEIARSSLLGRRVQRYVTSGRLVPDALVVQVMARRLDRKLLRRGFVLDGFPRTAGQAAGFDRVLRRVKTPLDGALYLTSPVALLVRRLSGRQVCPRCGTNYHVRTMRPKHTGRCDHCRTRLAVRKDDQPVTVRRRLAVDRAAAKPLVAYYRRQRVLYPVNGIGHIHTVFRRVLALCRRQGWLSRHDRTQKRARD